MATITDVDEHIINSNLRFTTKFYNELSRNHGNVIFSPLGVYSVLSMIYQGSNEETEKQFARTLNVPNKKAAVNGYNLIMNFLNNLEEVTFYIANKIYIMKSYSLETTFEEVVTNIFSSEIESVNFDLLSTEIANKINKWIEMKTDANFKNIISPDSLKSDIQLVAVNAVCFKGKWLDGFVKHATRVDSFFVANEEKVDCYMMYVNRQFKYKVNEDLDAEILELPYMNENVSMVIILPRSKNGITDLEHKLMNIDLSILTQNVLRVRVKVHLPKFKIEGTVDMKPILKEMSLDMVFDPVKANLSGISTNSERLCVNEIIQKVIIEVNEEGSGVALSEDEVPVITYCGKRPLPEFTADHPFMVLLQVNYGQSANIIFCGKVLRPESTNGSI
ncbi:hypothetical protein ILUMI_00467 [Ignelater luminosus]|uniref:Serpin domain-containing protein n=1 Tax=Ignelater luminosus TaxID=2038154 RepID=A0A8K0DGE2_IGNLU|nr:hypothetical protein ILUMI_00467 [Ignelater luminosus]